MYATRHTSEVVGMVLVDASHPDMWQRLPAEVTATLTGPAWQAATMRLMARLGLFRLTNGDFTNCGLPAVQCAEERAFASSARKWDIQAAEMYAPERDAQVRDAGNFGTRPLVVLTAGDHGRDFAAGLPAAVHIHFERAWRELQVELVALSTNSLQRIVDGAGHQSLQLDQAYVQITSAAILQVVEAARTGEPLAR